MILQKHVCTLESVESYYAMWSCSSFHINTVLKLFCEISSTITSPFCFLHKYINRQSTYGFCVNFNWHCEHDYNIYAFKQLCSHMFCHYQVKREQYSTIDSSAGSLPVNLRKDSLPDRPLPKDMQFSRNLKVQNGKTSVRDACSPRNFWGDDK